MYQRNKKRSHFGSIQRLEQRYLLVAALDLTGVSRLDFSGLSRQAALIAQQTDEASRVSESTNSATVKSEQIPSVEATQGSDDTPDAGGNADSAVSQTNRTNGDVTTINRTLSGGIRHPRELLKAVRQGSLDYGDLPDSFGTLNKSDGARHLAAGPRLGDSRDAEFNGDPQASADGDDEDYSNDEDGVTFGQIVVGSSVAAMNVDFQNATSGLIDAWLDFNGDGIWQRDEQILSNQPITDAGPVQTLNFTVPDDAVPGTTYARVRISSDGNLGPTGYASDGEVEDYQVNVLNAPTVESVVVNDNESSRSHINSVTVTFDHLVDVDSQAISLVNQTTEEVVNVGVDLSDVDGKTSAVITFLSGPSVSPLANGENTLDDGAYELVVDSRRIRTSATDITMAEDFRFGSTEADRFFRLFGDWDGDSNIDGRDFGAFASTFGKSQGQQDFLAAMDYDQDGDVDSMDYMHFKTRFTTKIEFPTQTSPSVL